MRFCEIHALMQRLPILSVGSVAFAALLDTGAPVSGFDCLIGVAARIS